MLVKNGEGMHEYRVIRNGVGEILMVNKFGPDETDNRCKMVAELNLEPGVTQHRLLQLLCRRAARHLPGPFIFQKIPEYPGISLGAAADHNPVAAGLLFHF